MQSKKVMKKLEDILKQDKFNISNLSDDVSREFVAFRNFKTYILEESKIKNANHINYIENIAYKSLKCDIFMNTK